MVASIEEMRGMSGREGEGLVKNLLENNSLMTMSRIDEANKPVVLTISSGQTILQSIRDMITLNRSTHIKMFPLIQTSL